MTPTKDQIINFSKHINKYSKELTKFISQVFPINYPEDWIENILLSEKDGHFCYGVVENKGSDDQNDQNFIIKSILIARILNETSEAKVEEDEDITIPDLSDRLKCKNICYIIMIGTKKIYRRNNYATRLYEDLKKLLLLRNSKIRSSSNKNRQKPITCKIPIKIEPVATLATASFGFVNQDIPKVLENLSSLEIQVSNTSASPTWPSGPRKEVQEICLHSLAHKNINFYSKL